MTRPTLVFIGDSITDCDRRLDARGLGGGYVDIIASSLADRGDDATVVNTGISGDRVEQLQQRWHDDALAHRPSILSVYIGVNDTLVTFYQGRPTPPDVFERRYIDILDQAVAAGVPQLILVEPFFVAFNNTGSPWGGGIEFVREDLDRKRPIVRDLATRYRAAFVPLQATISAAVDERGPAVVAPDGVHPSAYGHRLIAARWLQTYDDVSSVRASPFS
jgi:acyl-CoA thioesterase-1